MIHEPCAHHCNVPPGRVFYDGVMRVEKGYGFTRLLGGGGAVRDPRLVRIRSVERDVRLTTESMMNPARIAAMQGIYTTPFSHASQGVFFMTMSYASRVGVAPHASSVSLWRYAAYGSFAFTRASRASE